VPDGVVITGLGTLGAPGAGHRLLAADLVAGRQRATRIEPTSESPAAAFASQVPALDLSRWVPVGPARRMSRPSRFAVAAGVMALESAGLEVGSGGPALAVSMASTFGPLSYTQRLLDQIRDEGPCAASPALFTECVVNAPVSQVSIVVGAGGPCTTISGREAGPLLATGRGCTDLAEGRASTALVGACDEVTALQFDVLSRLGALAQAGSDGVIEARPFDRRRRGFLLAEGATMLVLEGESLAERRGANPIARIRAWGSAFDPTATRAGWGRGSALLARELGDCLGRAGISRAEVGLIVSGASGARSGDWLEARTLHQAWRDLALPPVVAPKAVTGEYGGGFLAAAILALQGGIAIHPDFELDPEVGLCPRSLDQPPQGCVLVTSLASGGAASWIVLERP
jgi:3-oxoacyl-[acyl-carrier-protein] synthase II